MNFEFEGKTVEVKNPTPDDLIEARLFSGGVFKKAIDKDNPPPARDKLGEYLTKLGLWDENKDKLLKDLSGKILDGERQLARGGRTKEGDKFTKEQARELALNMRAWRNEQLVLLLQLRSHDYLSLEGIVEDANFNFLVSRCSYMDGKLIYKDYNDYMSQQNSELAFKCAQTLSKMLYGDNTLSDAENAENKFLLKYKYVNDQLKLIDENGNLVDFKGRKINDNGRLINEQGELIDIDGNRVDEEGNPIEIFVDYD